MKKMLGLFLISILLVGCRVSTLATFEDDYPSMSNQEHVYQKANYSTALNVLLNETGVVLLAFDTKKYSCPYCQEVVPLLNEVALEEEWDVIYYLDIYDMRMQNTAEYRLLLGYLDSQTGSILEKEGVKTLIVPDVYFVKDGVIKAHHIATLTNDENRFILGLDELQQQTLQDLYRSYFELLK